MDVARLTFLSTPKLVPEKEDSPGRMPRKLRKLVLKARKKRKSKDPPEDEDVRRGLPLPTAVAPPFGALALGVGAEAPPDAAPAAPDAAPDAEPDAAPDARQEPAGLPRDGRPPEPVGLPPRGRLPEPGPRDRLDAAQRLEPLRDARWADACPRERAPRSTSARGLALEKRDDRRDSDKPSAALRVRSCGRPEPRRGLTLQAVPIKTLQLTVGGLF